MMPRQPIPVRIPDLRALGVDNVPVLAPIEVHLDLLPVEVVVPLVQGVLQAGHVAGRVQDVPGLDARDALAGLEHEHERVEAVESLGELGAEEPLVRRRDALAICGVEVVPLAGVGLLRVSGCLEMAGRRGRHALRS